MLKIKLSYRIKKAILACGADSKGAFALAEGERAYLVDGFGDLTEVDNLARYEKAIIGYRRKLGIKPKIIACDLHPGYYSSNFAESHRLAMSPGHALYRVQHHEAHIASAVIDNSLRGNVIGLAFDGTGLGYDDNIWGGEIFVGNVLRLKRVAHFEYIPMPGGDKVVTEPWRMASSYLYRVFGEEFVRLKADFMKRFDLRKWAVFKDMIDKKVNSPLTSSLGRFFDAAGSLVLSKNDASFEAELPMKLEAMTLESCPDAYAFDIRRKGDMSVIGYSKIIRGLVGDLAKGVDRHIVSTKFHNSIISVAQKICVDLGRRFGIKKVVLSGGVFQNRFLTGRLALGLEEGGFKVYKNRCMPTNDSGIAAGQIAIASERLSLCA